jgi:hypothetical protein
LITGKQISDYLAYKLVYLLVPHDRRTSSALVQKRDGLIIETVDRISVHCNVPCTKNPASTKAAACTIVAEALRSLGENISEGRVARIWQDALKRGRKLKKQTR